jgi:predicted nucleic acid-binding protein
MVIVDASVVIDFLANRVNPQAIWLDLRIDQQRIGITSLALSEVMQGIRYEAQAEKILRRLSRFEVSEVPSETLAIAAARNYRQLRTLGITVRSTIDCIIATFCIEENHILLHNDGDFDAFEEHLDLRVLHP